MYDAPAEDLEKVLGKAKTPNFRKPLKIWLDEKS
jgi:hypothetical protein